MNQKEHWFEFPLEIEATNFELELRATFTYQPGRPAYVSGLPENCYPADPEEIEVFCLEIKDGQTWRDVSTWLDFENLLKIVEGEVWEYVHTGLYDEAI